MSAAQAELARALVVWASASVAGTTGGVLFEVIATSAGCPWLRRMVVGYIVGTSVAVLVVRLGYPAGVL